jgi:tetratricopeptide (TPR) repeat protein
MVSARRKRWTRILIVSISAIAGCADAQVVKEAFEPGTVPPAAPASPPKLSFEQRGDLYMARKMYREAIETYREGAQNSAVLWDKIGIAYHQLGDLASAKKSYEHAIKLDKKYPDAINNIGTVLYAQKKYRSAISRYNRALTFAPESASIWSNLGTALYARGKFEEMTKAYAKALELDPNVFEAHGSVGTRMQDRGVADKARYHYEMARMYANAGKNELALQYLRKALEEGFKEREKLEQAKEFTALRDTPEFKELMTLEPRVL